MKVNGGLKRWALCVLAVAFSCGLSACHFLSPGSSCNKPGVYMQAQTLSPLKIPAGLSSPDTSKALHIPDLHEPAPPPRQRGERCLDEPPAYAVPKPAPRPDA